MHLFFEPQKVALIGASATALRPGNNLCQNMAFCFGENFYPINPRVEKIGERPCYASVLDVPTALDLVVIFIQAAKVPKALEQCAQKGVRRVIIESGGFAETGAQGQGQGQGQSQGQVLAQRCLQIAKANGMRIWGPNCMGLINVHRKKVLSFIWPGMWQDRFVPGSTSLVVQSGMLSAGFLSTVLFKTPFGLSKVCSIGNKMDVDEVDVLEYLVQDPETRVIAMYLESIDRGRAFFELARSTDKPIVVLKAGRTRFGSSAAASHTAALAQNDRIIDGAFRQADIVRVSTMNELLEVARCMDGARQLSRPVYRAPPVHGAPPVLNGEDGEDGEPGKDGEDAEPGRRKSPRVVVLTFSGGAGVVSADDVHDLDMDLAALSPETLAKLRGVFPEWMEPANPVDLYPAIEKRGPEKVWPEALKAILEDPGVDAVVAHIFAPGLRPQTFNVEQFTQTAKSYDKPIAAWVLGAGDHADKLIRDLTSAGIPAVDEPAKAVRILAALTMRR